MKKVSMELRKEYINKGAKCVALDKELNYPERKENIYDILKNDYSMDEFGCYVTGGDCSDIINLPNGAYVFLEINNIIE